MFTGVKNFTGRKLFIFIFLWGVILSGNYYCFAATDPSSSNDTAKLSASLLSAAASASSACQIINDDGGISDGCLSLADLADATPVTSNLSFANLDDRYRNNITLFANTVFTVISTMSVPQGWAIPSLAHFYGAGIGLWKAEKSYISRSLAIRSKVLASLASISKGTASSTSNFSQCTYINTMIDAYNELRFATSERQRMVNEERNIYIAAVSLASGEAASMIGWLIGDLIAGPWGAAQSQFVNQLIYQSKAKGGLDFKSVEGYCTEESGKKEALNAKQTPVPVSTDDINNGISLLDSNDLKLSESLDYMGYKNEFYRCYFISLLRNVTGINLAVFETLGRIGILSNLVILTKKYYEMHDEIIKNIDARVAQFKAFKNQLECDNTPLPSGSPPAPPPNSETKAPGVTTLDIGNGGNGSFVKSVCGGKDGPARCANVPAQIQQSIDKLAQKGFAMDSFPALALNGLKDYISKTLNGEDAHYNPFGSTSELGRHAMAFKKKALDSLNDANKKKKLPEFNIADKSKEIGDKLLDTAKGIKDKNGKDGDLSKIGAGGASLNGPASGIDEKGDKVKEEIKAGVTSASGNTSAIASGATSDSSKDFGISEDKDSLADALQKSNSDSKDGDETNSSVTKALGKYDLSSVNNNTKSLWEYISHRYRMDWPKLLNIKSTSSLLKDSKDTKDSKTTGLKDNKTSK